MYSVHTWSILDITGTNMYQTHFNFPSGSIRLATPTSLRRTLLPVNDLSELSIGSLLNRQTSQAWLSASKLPQPRVDLIDIAASPSIQRCCIGAPHREARILSLTEDVRDCWCRVSCQKQRDEGDSAHHVFGWSHVETGSWRRFIQLDYPRVLHGPPDGQFELLKGAEEHQVVQEVIKLRITQQCNNLPQLFSCPSVEQAFLKTVTGTTCIKYVQCMYNK